MIESGSLFADIPETLAAEQLTTLLAKPNLRIERIVSRGHASPPGFWYDQPQAEWVIGRVTDAGEPTVWLAVHYQ
jgi:cupin 2 domain-containing protein